MLLFQFVSGKAHTSLPVKNAKVTLILGERQIKVGSHRLSSLSHPWAGWSIPTPPSDSPAFLSTDLHPFLLGLGTFGLTMYHLLLLSGLLTGVPPWGACAPREAGHHEEHPLDSVLVTLNDR